MHLQPAAEVRDVVQRAARRRAHERVDVRTELDERFGEMRAHESIGAGHEHRPVLVVLGELLAQLRERFVGPHRDVSV